MVSSNCKTLEIMIYEHSPAQALRTIHTLSVGISPRILSNYKQQVAHIIDVPQSQIAVLNLPDNHENMWL